MIRLVPGRRHHRSQMGGPASPQETTRAWTSPRKGRPASAAQVHRTVAIAIASGETFSAGVLPLVQNTLVAATNGARDVGTAIGMVGVAAVRGSIRAAYDIGGDLGLVAKG